MELRHLRYLVKVGEERSFTGAARASNVSQPTLSQQIKDLEEELGAKLFARDRHTVTVTQAGELAIDHGRRVLSAVDALRQALAEHQGLRRGRLRLATSETFNALYLPDIIDRFGQDFPDIDLSVREMPNVAIVAALHEGSIDLGVGSMVSQTIVNTTPLYTESFMFVCAKRHRLAGQSQTLVESLDNETMALFVQGFTVRRAIDEILDAAHIKLRRAMEFNTLSAILSVVSRGGAVSIVPAIARHVSPSLGLSFSTLKPAPPHRVVSLMLPNAAMRTPASRVFEDYVIEHFRARPRVRATANRTR